MSLGSDPPPSIHSPRSGRAAARSHPSSPRSHVAPASLSSPAAAAIPYPERFDATAATPDAAAWSESAESNGDAAAVAAQGRKAAWNRPTNGSIEAGPVMGADSWPALSESTRAAPKSSSASSLNAPADGSVSAPLGPAITSSPPKASTSNQNPSPVPNHAAPARQKSMKCGGGGGASSSSSQPANDGLPPPSLPPAFTEMPPVASGRQGNPEPSPRDPSSEESSNWGNGSRDSGFMPQSHSGVDHHRGYSSYRRGGGGGGGSHHGGFGNRRDHGRGVYDWNPPRSFGGRNSNGRPPPPQHRGHPRPFFRPPPPATAPAPFIRPPPPVRPFVNPMVFPDIPSHVYYVPTPPPPESIRGMPFVSYPMSQVRAPAIFIAPPDHQWAMLLKQINYYFSSENLYRDTYLRRNMDEHGWVPISLIAGFNRVKQLTNDIRYILDVLRSSTLVEIQGEKIRRRNDWMNWILPASFGQHGTTSSPQSSAIPNYEGMVAHMQSVGLEEGDTNNSSTRGPIRTDTGFSRPASGNFRTQSQVGDTNGEGNGQSERSDTL